MERERGMSMLVPVVRVGHAGSRSVVYAPLVKGVPTPRSGGWRRRRWRLHYRVHGKSRVYKLMHVKSLERNRPACIMERNAVRVRPAGLFQAPPCKRRRCQGVPRVWEGELRGRPVTLLTDTTCMDGELTYNEAEWSKMRLCARYSRAGDAA